MSKSKILLIVFILVAIGGSFLGREIGKKIQASKEKEETLIKEEVWATFQKYLSAAKDKDLETLKTVSYELGETCRDESKMKECEDLMGNAYFFGIEMKKESFTEIAYDDRQIILFGEYKEEITSAIAAVSRPIIYIIREDDGVFKLLSFNPFQGSFLLRGDNSTSTIREKLADVIRDTDKDTLSDVIETCTEDVPEENCTKTDPKKRDTDNDGFWDSTESLFRD